MDPSTTFPAPPTAAAPPRRLATALLGLAGVLLLAVGLCGLTVYGYLGWLAGVLMGVPAAAGVAALAGAWQTWRRRGPWWLGPAAAVVALGPLALAGRELLSPWHYRAVERSAWRRYQAAADDADRWYAYCDAVPEPFRRPEAEVMYLRFRVSEFAGLRLRHMLRQLLHDVEVRHGDDPAYEPVRRAAEDALARIPREPSPADVASRGGDHGP